MSVPATPPMQMEHTECSETLTHKIQNSWHHPKETVQGNLYL